MRVFVVGTGRCGSVTFARACEASIENYTVGHETRARFASLGRLNYPDQHIESDHRLGFFVGSIRKRWRPSLTFFVHLRRDAEATAQSWAKRYNIRGGLMPAFANGIVFRGMGTKRPPRPAHSSFDPVECARLYVRTMNDQIECALQGHREKIELWIDDLDESAAARFLQRIGAEGDSEEFVRRLREVHNAGK